MPSISTHVLNSENGTHVAGLTVTLTYIEPDGGRKKIFSNKTDAGGRLIQNFDFSLNQSPTNPKTSSLASLSIIKSLKDY